LQEDGHGVLVLSDSADEALAAADVGVAVVRPGTRVCWSADLLCGSDVSDAWRVLVVAAAARPLSERVVLITQAGTALSTLLALLGPRHRRTRYALLPVHAGAVLGLIVGTVTAHNAVRQSPPVLVASSRRESERVTRP
jgi:cation-transporting ATPase I